MTLVWFDQIFWDHPTFNDISKAGHTVQKNDPSQETDFYLAAAA